MLATLARLALAQTAASGCGPMSFPQMGSALQLALQNVGAISDIKNRLARTAASHLLCDQLAQARPNGSPGSATAPKTTDQCLSEVLLTSIGAQCAQAAPCESARAQAVQLCGQLQSIGCKPKVCGSSARAPPPLDKSLGLPPPIADAALRRLTPAALRAEQWARAPEHVRASAWFAAVALASALLAGARTARQVLSAQADSAPRLCAPPASLQLI